MIDADGDGESLVQIAVIEHLASIQERAQDPAFVSTVVSLYLQHTPPLLDNLTTALAAADGVAISRLAHRIKGSSLSVGAKRLAKLCEQLEAEVDGQGNHEQLASRIDQIHAIYRKTASRLAELVQSLQLGAAKQHGMVL